MAPGYPFRPSGTFKKSVEITAAMERKKADIKSFQDLKGVSIAVSSAFNSASDLCTVLVRTGKLDSEGYWKIHEELYREFLSRFTAKQQEAKAGFYEVASKAAQAAAKHKDVGLDDAEREIGELF